LADLFRPPTEIMHPGAFADAKVNKRGVVKKTTPRCRKKRWLWVKET
jgi:hypothetical protein